MNSTMERRSYGFTLIELVVVIALLGILAAFAIPRFASLEREARIATTQGLAGSVRGAAAMAHSLFLAQNINPVAMEGVPINLTNGYPDATDVAQTLADTTGYNVIVNGGGDQASFTRVGAPDPTNCVVVYQDAAVNVAPNITITITGC